MLEYQISRILPTTHLGTVSFIAGLTWRYHRFQESTGCQMIGRIHHGIFAQRKYLPPKVDIGLKFQRSSDSFVIMTESTEKYIVNITDVKVYFRMVKLYDSVSNSLERALLDKSAIFPFVR